MNNDIGCGWSRISGTCVIAASAACHVIPGVARET